MIDELPVPICWRCGTECDTNWIDVGILSDPEPRVTQGATRCTNPRCPNRFSQTADRPPTPAELARRGEQVLHRVQAITLEALTGD